jgi:hypothetical protein
MGIPSNEVADGLARQAVESGSVHGQMTVANDHRILARQAIVKQWQHAWRTGDTGRFAYSIRPVVSVKPWFDGQVEERSSVTTLSRVMSGHCSIRAHLERFRIVGDPICVCMMNYETVDHIIWKCSRGRKTSTPVGTCGREYKRGNTNPESLSSIEVMP